MRRYELVTVVTDGHRIEGRRGVVLAFFGKIIAFFGNKRAILQLFTGVTDGHSGHRWSQMVTGGHSWSQNRRGLGAPVEGSPYYYSSRSVSRLCSWSLTHVQSSRSFRSTPATRAATTGTGATSSSSSIVGGAASRPAENRTASLIPLLAASARLCRRAARLCVRHSPHARGARGTGPSRTACVAGPAAAAPYRLPPAPCPPAPAPAPALVRTPPAPLLPTSAARGGAARGASRARRGRAARARPTRPAPPPPQ